MTARASVSVALCTHNGARFVRQQLDSILSQQVPPREVVVSDDASTDDTVAIVEDLWAELDREVAPTLRVLRNPVALGVARNFEQAVTACTSELIALSDQDDVWHLDRLKLVTDVFARRPRLDLLFTDARLVDETGRDLGTSLFEALEIDPDHLAGLRDGRAFEVLLKRNLATGATIAFRRRLLGATVPFDVAWVHDEWLAIIAAAVSELDWIDNPTIDYRQHGSNQIGVRAPTLRYKVRRLFGPRCERNAGLLARAVQLTTRLEQLGVGEGTLDLIRGKLEHERHRSALARGRLARLGPILREARSGRYARYSSQGALDVVRDLFQPDR